MLSKQSVIVAASLLAVGLIVSSLILGGFFVVGKRPVHTLKVVGIASQRFPTNMVKWSAGIRETSGLSAAELGKAYQNLGKKIDFLIDELIKAGIPAEAITQQPVESHFNYNRNGEKTGYEAFQNFFVITNQMEIIENIALNPSRYLQQGIVLERSNLEYFNEQIDHLKKELLKNAMANARERAQAMLENTGLEIGSVLSARSGVFQITEPYSTEIASYGVYNTASKNKEIKVTVHVEFSLKQ